ncbi:PIN domain-containing protein [Micromonospora sp. NPDC051925]|uniref:PIN domain-containing protein n=1 Tax=Micromonospora sp. NPDC051925 TaxID=3364288 RepID=UPI0037C57DA8
MLVTPLPWTDRRRLLDVLRQLHVDAMNARSATELTRAYFQWCENALSQLRSMVSQADVDRLILTQAHWTLLNTSMIGTPQINALRSRELERCVADVDAAVTSLEQLIERWSGRGVFLVPDTCFFMNYPSKFNELDYWDLLDTGPMTQLHVVIPMPVIDELDGLKKSKIENRYRAGASLRIIQELFGDKPNEIQTLRGPELRPASNGHVFQTESVTAEILFDPPGHQRVEIMDDEIVRRAASIQPYAGFPITLLTYDTNMELRAKAAGLSVKLLVDEKDERDTKVAETVAQWMTEVGNADANPAWQDRLAQLRQWSKDSALSGTTKFAAGSLMKQADTSKS